MSMKCNFYIAMWMLLLSVHNTLTATTLTKGNSQIILKHALNAQLENQAQYCAEPHNSLFNIRFLISNDSEGMLTNHENVSHLIEDVYFFEPQNILVKRYDKRCKFMGREDADVLDCNFTTEKVLRVFSATKDGDDEQTEYYELHVLQHTTCKYNNGVIDSGKSALIPDSVIYFLPIIFSLILRYYF
ncbi:unnamed protein product [Meganyctiphanes norvegica]|uniref:Uncharacterized protein n=1 Tax=Meganyctiphanes norvegica TaxID=48144 RepID=A0AAV2QBS1_MEGNR